MMAITPAKIVQSETAADTYIDNGGLFPDICENEILLLLQEGLHLRI